MNVFSDPMGTFKIRILIRKNKEPKLQSLKNLKKNYETLCIEAKK